MNIKKYLIAICLFLSFPAFALSANDDALKALTNFYTSAKEENLQNYINSQDIDYLNSVYSDPAQYSNIFKSAFQVYDTENFEIINPVFIAGKDSVMVFYNLKAVISLAETKEKKNIDNDMTAMLVKIGSEWKVRFAILREVYENNLNMEMANKASFNMTIEDATLETTGESLKQEMINAGLYKEENYNLLENKTGEIATSLSETAQPYNPAVNVPTAGGNYVTKLIVAAIVIGGAYAFGKKKYPAETDKIVAKIWEITKLISVKIFDLLKILAVKLTELVKFLYAKIVEILKKRNKK